MQYRGWVTSQRTLLSMWAVYVEFSSSSYQTRPCDEERVIQKSANETSDRTQAVQLSDRTRTQTSGAEPLSRKVIKSCSGSYRMLSDVLNGPAATTRLRPSAPQSLYSFIHLLPKWHTDKKTRQKPKNTRQKAKIYYLLNVQSTVVLNYVLQCTSETPTRSHNINNSYTYKWKALKYTVTRLKYMNIKTILSSVYTCILYSLNLNPVRWIKNIRKSIDRQVSSRE